MWISVKNSLPMLDETVWLTNGKAIWLGCRAICDEDNESRLWCWAVSNGIMTIENGRIVSECEFDDIEVTHWHALPNVDINESGI